MGKSQQETLLPTESVNRPSRERAFAEAPRTEVRVKQAQRSQREMITRTLDELLPEEHLARDIWAITSRLDLSELYARIGSRGSNAGAFAVDPQIPLCLWIYATCKGEGSSHELSRLCLEHNAYRWICGGVSVKQRHLSSFRANSAELFSSLITQVVAVMLKGGLCSLERYAQDGTRVRASAGAASFRREETLAQLREEARVHLDEVLRDAEHGKQSALRRAARERGARDRLSRLDAAIAELPAAAETKKRNRDDTPPRVSTTDPESRVMKRGDAGFRPAFNVQFATTTDAARLIVGVDVTNAGSDQHLAEPMVEQIERRYDQRPVEIFLDGGYLAHDTLDTLAPAITVYAPLPKPRKDQRPPTEARNSDSPATAEWRQRMQTDAAKLHYRARAATAETVNADGKAHRGLDHVPIRGLPNALGFACLFALSYDILRTISLCRAV